MRNFVNALDFMSQRKYDKAADEFLDSKWATQVGNRAQEVAYMIRTNKYPD